MGGMVRDSGRTALEPRFQRLRILKGRLSKEKQLSLLVLKLGPGAVDIVAHHALPVVGIAGLLAVGGFAWWWFSKKRTGKQLDS